MNKDILLEKNWSEEEMSFLTINRLEILEEYYSIADLDNISPKDILAGINVIIDIKNNKIGVIEENTQETKEPNKESSKKVENDSDDDFIEEDGIENLSIKENVLFLKFLRHLKPEDSVISNKLKVALNNFNKERQKWGQFNQEISKGNKLIEVLKQERFLSLKKEFLSTLKKIKAHPTKLEKILNLEANRQVNAGCGKLFLKIIYSLSNQISRDVQLKVKSFFSKWQPETDSEFKKRIKEKAIQFTKK